MARVRFDSGPREGEVVELVGPRTVFGRHKSCDCIIAHPTVSRRHFSIEIVQGKHLLVDEKSGNGTFVNGRAVSWIELSVDDTISVGPFALRFEAEAESAGGTPASSGEDQDHRTPEGFPADFPREYLAGIEHFNTGRFFDAHEIWEEIWLRSSDESKIFYQMLIQSAVALLHYQRGNLRGARGMYDAVLQKLGKLPRRFLALDLVAFEKQFRRFFSSAVDAKWESRPQNDPEPIMLIGIGDQG
jgi:hypothetical protein